MSAPFNDITGQRFSRLVAVRKTDIRKDRRVIWECLCDCGNTTYKSSHELLRGEAKSCGCIAKEMRGEHGFSKSRLYGVWRNMRNRCNNKNTDSYKYYGAKGVSICDEWNDFAKFKDWAYENGYDENAIHGSCTLDRIDVCGNYSPDNCRWVSMKEQANNRSSNVNIRYDGDSHTVAEWSDITGINASTIRARLNRGWEESDALAEVSK